MAQKQPLKSESTVKKTFSYSQDNVSLSFTLRIDAKIELVAFLALLKEATKDIEAELQAMKK